MNFTIYTKSTCPWCDKAFDLLSSINATVTLKSVSIPEHREFVIAQGYRTVPQIYHGDHRVGGYEDLVVYLTALEVVR